MIDEGCVFHASLVFFTIPFTIPFLSKIKFH